jgi:hypothetical protein
MRSLARLFAAAVVVLAVAVPASAAPAKSASFTTYSLGEATGTTCPGSSACSNFAAEPAIRADGAGRFFGSSENGLGGGTVAFRSTDNGLHYTTLVSPNGVSQTNDTGFAPGGGDTDLAVAPDKNASGFYNVYVASLSLVNVDVSTSTDGGATWSPSPRRRQSTTVNGSPPTPTARSASATTTPRRASPSAAARTPVQRSHSLRAP